MIMISICSIAVVCVQWYLIGYSLAFSQQGGNPVIGNVNHGLLLGTNGIDPSVGNAKIPDLAFYIYQGMFAAITPAIIVGSGAERARFLPTLIFIFLWTTFVYDFLAFWTWNPHGFSAKMGCLDFAGGIPVHIASGFSAIIFALVLGPRQDNRDGKRTYTPHDTSNVVLGLAFLWFGWFGFNGGSALAGTSRAVMACVVTNLAACIGGLTWGIFDYRHGYFSPVGFCSGVVAGLVAITPASGFVSPGSAIAIGFFGSLSAYMAQIFKNSLFYFDDAVDVFVVHGVPGLVGSILTGILAQKSIAALDGTIIEGGWIDGNYKQLGYQLVASIASITWIVIVTFIILHVINIIPGLHLRAKPEIESEGVDKEEFGIGIRTSGNYNKMPSITHSHRQQCEINQMSQESTTAQDDMMIEIPLEIVEVENNIIDNENNFRRSSNPVTIRMQKLNSSD